MTDRELMQQALEALNRSDYLGWQLNIPIIKSLREWLAQPEQRPIQECYGDCPTNPQTCINPCNFEGRLNSQRKLWVGLTDEEIEGVCIPLGAAMLSFTEVARAIEAKLKEKNT